jgi:hypothetical protein
MSLQSLRVGQIFIKDPQNLNYFRINSQRDRNQTLAGTKTYGIEKDILIELFTVLMRQSLCLFNLKAA